jgi:hypothetical protein
MDQMIPLPMLPGPQPAPDGQQVNCLRASWCDHVAHCSLYPHYRCLPSLMTHSSLCPLLPSPPPYLRPAGECAQDP